MAAAGGLDRDDTGFGATGEAPTFVAAFATAAGLAPDTLPREPGSPEALEVGVGLDDVGTTGEGSLTPADGTAATGAAPTLSTPCDVAAIAPEPTTREPIASTADCAASVRVSPPPASAELSARSVDKAADTDEPVRTCAAADCAVNDVTISAPDTAAEATPAHQDRRIDPPHRRSQEQLKI